MSSATEHNAFISLSQAAKLAPGRPSTNCLWRWARRGVQSRSGHRVYLEHVRLGGKVYTKVQWLEEFGRTLAQADVEYFRDRAEGRDDHPHVEQQLGRSDHARQEHLRRIEAELAREGL